MTKHLVSRCKSDDVNLFFSSVQYIRLQTIISKKKKETKQKKKETLSDKSLR